MFYPLVYPDFYAIFFVKKDRMDNINSPSFTRVYFKTDLLGMSLIYATLVFTILKVHLSKLNEKMLYKSKYISLKNIFFSICEYFTILSIYLSYFVTLQ